MFCSYEHILVAPPVKFNQKLNKCLLGEWAKVKIINVSKFYLKAELITSFYDFNIKNFNFIKIKEFVLVLKKKQFLSKILFLYGTLFLYFIINYLIMRFAV